ncbi:hypothetical protein [Vallitalea longa]|nr:hypothetical protein [Vallitalea longa]
MISIESENANQEKRHKSSKDIYLLAKELAEFIGNLDEKRNNTNDK